MSETNIVNLIDNRLKQELSELEVQKSNEIKILHEDMARRGQMNGTPCIMRVQSFCSQEIKDATNITSKIINEFMMSSGVKHSADLSIELKKIVKENFIKIGNYQERHPKINTESTPTLSNQMKSAENEINRQRNRGIDKINTEIDLLMLALKNKTKDEQGRFKKTGLANIDDSVQEDIIDIKPNFYGVGLNLNAFGRKCKSLFTKKKRA